MTHTSLWEPYLLSIGLNPILILLSHCKTLTVSFLVRCSHTLTVRAALYLSHVETTKINCWIDLWEQILSLKSVQAKWQGKLNSLNYTWLPLRVELYLDSFMFKAEIQQISVWRVSRLRMLTITLHSTGSNS